MSLDPEERHETFARFVADEIPALDQLRSVVGGELAGALDGSRRGLELLDEYLANVTARDDWSLSWPFDDLPNAVAWLSVRVAYYFGKCLRERHGAEWYPCDDPHSHLFGTPVMAVNGIQLSPLEVAHAAVSRDVQGGLCGVLDDLEHTAFGSQHDA